MSKSDQTGQKGTVVNNRAAAPQAQFRALQFDPAEFLHFIEDEDISEADAVALLEVIWQIMVAFVDLGFGIHPVQQAMDNSAEDETNAFSGFPDVLASMDLVPYSNKNNTERGHGRGAGKEES